MHHLPCFYSSTCRFAQGGLLVGSRVRPRQFVPRFVPRQTGRQARARSTAPAPTLTQRSTSSTWLAPRTLLLSALTGLTTYWYASWDGRVKSTAPKYATPTEMEMAIEEIRQTISDDVISTDDEDLLAHGYSEWSTTNVETLPVAVAYPKSTEEVSRIVKVCHKHRVPMIPFSGGTSLEGNFSAPYGGVSLDFTFMDQIVDFHEAEYEPLPLFSWRGYIRMCLNAEISAYRSMDIVVQPAVSWMNLNDQIRDHGLFFPVDPGPSAKIGGMENSGTNAVRYGTMKDWVINLTVVLADGTIIKTKQRPRKSSAGYNLTSLFVGSEGTLGIATEITLKLAVVPQETSVAVVTFPSVRSAAEAASQVMRAGVPIGAVEIMDEVQMSVINKTGTTPRRWKEAPTLFFKFSGTKAGVEENIGLVKAIAKCHGSGDFEFARDPEEQKTLWSARKEALWSMLALREKGADVWSTDVAVPLSRLSDIIEEISKREMDELGLFASILGHVGDGNFHESILYDPKNPEERDKVEKCVGAMVDRALQMEGTCTGEHGIGLGKKGYLIKELGPDTIGVMKSIKQSLDPYWLMNPGKIIDVPN
ncbi:MAG: hypothetical protein M1816_008273 [Peltula sp. TS41687]|nr:MAG: hypothetical protein M1816_008273 [Peltula sp. TS41687]